MSVEQAFFKQKYKAVFLGAKQKKITNFTNFPTSRQSAFGLLAMQVVAQNTRCNTRIYSKVRPLPAAVNHTATGGRGRRQARGPPRLLHHLWHRLVAADLPNVRLVKGVQRPHRGVQLRHRPVQVRLCLRRQRMAETNPPPRTTTKRGGPERAACDGEDLAL